MNPRSKKFGLLQKSLLAIGVFGLIGGATFFIGGVAGSTQFASTLLPPRLSASPDSGLVGHWTFDGKDVRTGQINDLSGNANSGSSVNIATSTFFTQGTIGQAINFDGIDDYINVTNTTGLNMTTSQAVTVSAWINTASTTGSTLRRIVSMPANESIGTEKYGLFMRNGVFNFILGVNAGDDTLTASFTSTSTWVHVVGVYQSPTMRIYVNGTQVATKSHRNGGGDIVDNTNGNLQIGRYGPTFGQYFEGKIDDVRVYNRAASNDEIKQLYQLGATTKLDTTELPPRLSASPDSGLVGHWTFDGKDTRTGQISDMSGNGYDGSMVSMSTSTAFTQGTIGQAIKTDGVNDSISFPISAATSAAADDIYSWAAWVKVASTGPSQIILSATDGSGRGDPNTVLEFNVDGTAANFNVTAAANNSGSVSSAIVFNVWTHLLAVKNTTRLDFYVNGVLAGSDTTVASAAALTPTSFRIGKPALNQRFFDGAVDDFRLYDRALTVDEIKQIYQLGATTKIGATPLPPRLSQSNDSGLIGHWTFDGKDTRTGQINDVSGSGNHGSQVSMSSSTAYTLGILGQALRFDGVDDYVSFGTSPQLTSTSPFSVAFWTYINRFTSGKYNNVIGLKTNLAEGYCIFISANTGYQGIAFGSPTLWYEGRTTGDISSSFLGGWKQVTLVYDGVSASSASSYAMYVDGSPVAIVANNGVSTISNTTALGSCNTSNANYWMDGNIDDTRIYNRALSADEIKQLYQMGK